MKRITVLVGGESQYEWIMEVVLKDNKDKKDGLEKEWFVGLIDILTMKI